MRLFRNLILIVFLCLFSVSNVYAQDALTNQTDDNNRKQGHWIFTNKTRSLPGYKNDQVVEDGYYENNRKVGIWTFYFNNGKVKHKLTYHNNQPNGPAVFYYKNGNIREQGTWKNNRWIGAYTMYHPDGKLKNEFRYNNQGVKDGAQKYYHENGNLMISGTWTNGEEGNDLHEYDKNGKPNTERYKAGPPIVKKTVAKKVEKIKEPIIKTDTTVTAAIDSTIRKKKKKVVPSAPFDGNGYHEFKDRYGRNIRVGDFTNGYLNNGKMFEYDKKGNVKTTKIIEDGKVVKVIQAKSIQKK